MMTVTYKEAIIQPILRNDLLLSKGMIAAEVGEEVPFIILSHMHNTCGNTAVKWLSENSEKS